MFAKQALLNAKFYRKHISQNKQVPTFVYTLSGSPADLAQYKAAQGWKSDAEPGFYREDADTKAPLFFTTRTNLYYGGTIIVTVNGKIAVDDTAETFEDAMLDKQALRSALAQEEAKQIIAMRAGSTRRFGTRTPAFSQALPNDANNPFGEPMNSELNMESEEERLLRERELAAGLPS